MSEQPVLIHMHLPKTGGKTVRFVLSRQFARGEVLHVAHPYEVPEPSFERWSRIKGVGGHFVYGIHERLGGRPYRYMTMLRSPVGRVISLYHFILRNTEHQDHKTLIESGHSLREWLELDAPPAATNLQTSFLAGMFPGPATTQAEFETARDHLENQIEAVGIMEQFDRSMLLYQKVFNWPNILYVARNVASGSAGRDKLDPDTLRLIEDRNSLDMALYEVARERFERDARAIGRAAVTSYRAANRAYGLVAGVRDTVLGRSGPKTP